MCPRVGVVGGIRGHVGGPVLPARLVCGLELWRTLIDANGGRVGYAAVAAGVGEARDAVGAHAMGELSACALTCCTWAAFGPLPPFGSRWRHALWADWNRELLTPSCCRAALLDRASAARGVRVVRHPVGAHAVGEGDRSVPLRRRCRGARGGAALRCGRAELRHVTPRRAAACRRQEGEADQRGHCGNEEQRARPTAARDRRSSWRVEGAGEIGEPHHALDLRSAR